MLKWLVFLVVVAWLASNWSRRRDGLGRDQPPDRGSTGTPGAREGHPPAERMLRCDHCRVHVPESVSVRREGHTYCSAAHADAARPGDGRSA